MALADTIYSLGENPTYRGILDAAGTATQAFNSLTRKVRSLDSDERSPETIRDYNTNGFLAQKSVFSPTFFARMFDEPTYLTFKIEFMVDDPVNESRNTAYNNSGILDSAMTNVYYSVMYDHMPEPFLDNYIFTGKSVDTSTGKRYSTEAYLDLNLGDHGRAQLLHNFKMALADIEKNFPYYFTSISGLDSLVKVDPKTGIRLKDCKIELECIEGLDLKITQLMQLYRKIVWDDVYQRWVLPDMMRYFGMRIYVSEMRLFSSTKKESSLGPKIYDFREPKNRNMTFSGETPSNQTEDIIKQGNVVSQAFLGTKSIITQALDYTSATMTTLQEGYRNITGAFNQVQYCNNAINEVMPTICFECHMCEFDIEDTLSHIGTLSSSKNGSNEIKPKIKIKIGQVKESQSYPLNESLNGSEINGYNKTIGDLMRSNIVPEDLGSTITKINDLYELRGKYNNLTKEYKHGNLTFSGNFISDKSLTRLYTSDNLGKRVSEYISNLKHDVGETKGGLISERRFNTDKIINESQYMQYMPDDLPKSAANAGLFAAAMNEAVSIAYHAEVDSNIVGTRSLATDQTSSVRNSLEAIKATMFAALDRIYKGQEIQSMAVHGVPEETRAILAHRSFSEFISNLENSTATQDPLMRSFLMNYRKIENTKYISKATNTTFNNLN